MTRGQIIATALALTLLVSVCAAAIASQSPSGVSP